MSAGAIGQARREIGVAGALWRERLIPEAHAHMATALRLALEPWATTGEAPSPEDAAEPRATSEERAVGALTRAGYRSVDGLRAALAATRAITANDVATTGATSMPKDFEWIWAQAERLCRFSARRFATPMDRKRARVRRGIGAGLAIFVALLVIGRVWLRPHVSASGMYSPDFPISYAVDGIESTEWLLPDRTPGWLQISFPRSRDIHRITLVNGHNRWYMDRAVDQVRVTAFSKKGPVATVDGRFPALTEQRSALELKLEAEDVDAVRVDVLSYFGNGGALAELDVR